MCDYVLSCCSTADLKKEHFERRNISSLSGGQQQRVAIARAIANHPKVLLLDEPLAALDLKLRKDMQKELKKIQQQLGITFVFVTHDQEEALTMSDRVIVMDNGKIQQIGTPQDIYNEPENAFVADFIGESNIFVGSMYDNKKVRFLNKVWDCIDDFPIHEKVDVVTENIVFRSIYGGEVYNQASVVVDLIVKENKKNTWRSK